MPSSTCGKCGAHAFVGFTPVGEGYKMAFVQCSSCGVPVGVVDLSGRAQTDAVATQVRGIDERLTRIAKALTQ